MNKVVITTVMVLILCTGVSAHLGQVVTNGPTDPLIRIEPACITVSPGETFTVNITLNPNGTTIAGVDYILHFDNTLLNATTATPGDFFSGFTTQFFGEGINNSLGEIDYGESIWPITGDGVTVPGIVTTITFQAIGTHGTSDLEFLTVTLSDPDGTKITADVQNGSVEITTPIPFMIYGYVSYDFGGPCKDPTVTIKNLNTREHWNAETSTSSHYYQLSLMHGQDIFAGDVLRFNVTGPYGSKPNVTEHTITQDEVNTGGLFNFNISIETEPISFDTGAPDNPYPSIRGVHNGTIKPDRQIEANTIYTYSCPGTGGHAEYARIWGNGVDAVATWNGYNGDWHNLTFDQPLVLIPGKEYNYSIRTGSYPQIIHAPSEEYPVTGGAITCDEFTDANGISHENWIPAFRLWHT